MVEADGFAMHQVPPDAVPGPVVGFPVFGGPVVGFPLYGGPVVGFPVFGGPVVGGHIGFVMVGGGNGFVTGVVVGVVGLITGTSLTV